MEPIRQPRDNKINLQKDLDDVRDSISKTAFHAKNKVQDTAENLASDAKDKANEISGELIKLVKQNPLATVGYALLTGFLIAQLIRK